MDDTKIVGVIGDPLDDIYLIGTWNKNRFKPNQEIRKSGGAGNVFDNLRTLTIDCLNTKGVYPLSFYPFTFPLKLYRLVSSDKETIEFYIQSNTKQSLFSDNEEQKIYREIIEQYSSNEMIKITILSDYNKGIVSSEMPSIFNDINLGDCCIVDSRYRSTHTSWINKFPIKIWRCTGQEFDDIWSTQFDIIIHTNGPQKVILSSEKLGFADEFKVDNIDIIDTCGAGDTFDATLAFLLARETDKHHDIDWYYDACAEFIPTCIAMAQDVCTQLYTATPRSETIQKLIT